MEPIEPAAVDAALADLVGRTVHLHVETTAGAYTEGGFGAFIRNVAIALDGAAVRGTGPYRAGLRFGDGWVYTEGLTHWERDAAGRVLLAGHDSAGRLQVACTVSPTPLPAAAEPKSIEVTPATGPGSAAAAGPAPEGAVPAERAVLVCLAHPDDETFACGGTIALFSRAGVPVTLICGTRGEQGRNMGTPFFANRETLHTLRVRELTDACAMLGVRDLRLLGSWDKTSEFRDPEDLADRIEAVLTEVRPTLVITSHPVYGGHPDHCAIGEATLRAVRRLPAAERPRVRCSATPRAAEKAGLQLQHTDVSAAIDTKLAALRAHRSQYEPMIGRLAPEELAKRREMMSQERYLEVEP